MRGRALQRKLILMVFSLNISAKLIFQSKLGKIFANKLVRY